MKKFKILGLVLLLIVATISTTFAINPTLNLKMRRAMYENFDRYNWVSSNESVFYLSEKSFEKFEGEDFLFQMHQEGKAFVDLMWLRDIGFTYHYDEKNDELNIVGQDQWIKVNQHGKGSWNGKTLELPLLWVLDHGNVFLEKESLSNNGLDEIWPIEKIQSSKGNSVFYKLQNVNQPQAHIKEETVIYSTYEDAVAYGIERPSLMHFLSMDAMFSAVPAVSLIEDEQVYFYPVDQKIVYVFTTEGFNGYVLKSNIQPILTQLAESDVQNEVKKDPVILAWEAVYGTPPNPELIGPMKGVNVLSPTWYELSDSEGNVHSKRGPQYTAWAKENGYELWVLVSNAFNIDRTHDFLHDSKARKKFIDYMINEALTHGFEGINVDFEHMYKADRDAFTHFINELAYHMRPHGLVLSVDVTIMGGSDNWSKCYDHEYLGQIVDYLIIMTYDEHWAASPISGPVASYPWVRRAMLELVEVVDPDKLVLGLPFYSRVWREWPSETRANVMENRSNAFGITAQNRFLEDRNLTPLWEERTGMYYVSYIEEHAETGNLSLLRLWVENERTLTLKAELVNELGLAGVAGWTRAFAPPEIWEALYEVLY